LNPSIIEKRKKLTYGDCCIANCNPNDGNCESFHSGERALKEFQVHYESVNASWHSYIDQNIIYPSITNVGKNLSLFNLMPTAWRKWQRSESTKYLGQKLLLFMQIVISFARRQLRQNKGSMIHLHSQPFQIRNQQAPI
jgi:hypothetical protein